MNNMILLKRVVVRVIPLTLGMLLRWKIAQSFRDLTGVYGSMDSQFAPIAILAIILGIGIVAWSSFKEFKIPLVLSFVLMCCGTAMVAFGLNYLTL